MQEKYKSMSNVPNLRFPEFDGEWEVKKLGEVTDKIGDGLHGTPIYIEDSGFYFINGNNLVNGKIELNDNTKRIDLDTFSKNNKGLNENTLLISINGTIGSIAKYNQEKVMLGKSVGYFNFNNNSVFFYFALQTNSIQDYFISELTGSTIKNLSLKTLRETAVSFPSATEQQKISNFLSIIDERIQTQSKIIEESKILKATLSKKIFTQQLRFKDEGGNGFPDWEVKKLGEVCEIVMGQSPSSISYNTEEIGIPLIQGNADIFNRITSPRNWTTEITKKCLIGDLILTVRAPVGAVAKSAHNACIGRGVCGIRGNSSNSNEFIYQFLLDYEDKWNKLEQGSTFTAVSGNEIKKVEISIPSIKEQTKSANFLSSIDKKIEVENLLLKQLETKKKYLLSNLFI
jgi:type I restriction enzyme S subunit